MLIKLMDDVDSSTLEEVWMRNLNVAIEEENGFKLIEYLACNLATI